MHVKNAITVGIQVIEFFPMMDTSGKSIQDAIQDLLDGKKGKLPADLEQQCIA
jgi:hypothetical protein